MNKIILYAALTFCFESNAMNRNQQFEVPVSIIYTVVDTNPPVKVVQSRGFVTVGAIQAPNLKFSCQTYNGNIMHAPLDIEGSNSPETIKNALEASFGKQVTVQMVLHYDAI